VQLAQAKDGGLGDENINSPSCMILPSPVNSLFNMLCDVWAAKNQRSLLGVHSCGEEAGDDHPCPATGRPLLGVLLFELFFGKPTPTPAVKADVKGREKGVCVHASSHEPSGWRLVAAPAVR